MPTPKKLNMPVQQLTVFWKSLGIVTPKRIRVLRNYKHKSDMAALRRVGVNQIAIDKVYNICLKYNDDLLFRNFSRFFKKDIDTVKVWTNAKTASAAYLKLFNIFHRNSLENAKVRFAELALIFEFYKKGEKQIFSGKYKTTLNLKNFKTRNLRQRLNHYDGKAKYNDKGEAQFGKERVIWIEKKAENKTTNKFIKLSHERNILRVSLSMDSKIEYNIVKNELEKFFNTYLDTPESTKDFRKFIGFLRTGKSTHFVLTGATYQDSEFRVSIGSSNNRIENLTTLTTYKNKFATTSKKLEFLNQIRISYIDKVLNKPVFISILTYRDGIFGAILLNFDDKRLTSQQRRGLNKDFQSDFGLPLNEFLKYEDLTEQSIYKHFLQTISSRVSKIELRSTKAMSIYTSLLADKLIIPGDTVEETSKVCVNSVCPKYFKRIWDAKKHCANCGELLINGRGIEIKNIDETQVARFLKNNFVGGAISNVNKKLLSRAITVSQVTFNNDTADFIPISKPLNDNQIEVLKFRYPHSVIVTTHDDTDDLVAKGCQAVPLWEFVYSIKNNNAKLIKQLIRKAKVQSLTNMRVLCGTSVARVNDIQYYKDRNKEVKNLGAELFEADCSILFDYVFGNCIWLGAKHRGASVPDGFTAFPMLETNKGCFIWDGKFSEGKTLVMGKFSKNKTYIDDAKSNQSIKDNGGLKGFVFISNNQFPPSFVTKYLTLTKKRKLKLCFIRAIQFQKITEHYRQHETMILRNLRARNQFIDSMVDLFFSTSKGRKCEIISDVDIDTKIAADEAYFSTLSAGRTLTV